MYSQKMAKRAFKRSLSRGSSASSRGSFKEHSQGAKIRAEITEIAKWNLKLARKLIDTKSVISYDDQLRHSAR